MISDPVEIEIFFLSYYSNLFASDNNCVPNNLIQKVVPCLVPFHYNNMLIVLLVMDEVKSVVFGMNKGRALSPDGFCGHFY